MENFMKFSDPPPHDALFLLLNVSLPKHWALLISVFYKPVFVYFISTKLFFSLRKYLSTSQGDGFGPWR